MKTFTTEISKNLLNPDIELRPGETSYFIRRRDVYFTLWALFEDQEGLGLILENSVNVIYFKLRHTVLDTVQLHIAYSTHETEKKYLCFNKLLLTALKNLGQTCPIATYKSGDFTFKLYFFKSKIRMKLKELK
jgi:hypothetical protein